MNIHPNCELKVLLNASLQGLDYVPQKIFIDKTKSFKIPINEVETTFENAELTIDILFLEENKKYENNLFDLVLQTNCVDYDKVDQTKVKDRCSLATAFKIYPQGNEYKTRIESQKLLVKGNWFEMHDIYGMVADNSK